MSHDRLDFLTKRRLKMMCPRESAPAPGVKINEQGSIIIPGDGEMWYNIDPDIRTPDTDASQSRPL